MGFDVNSKGKPQLGTVSSSGMSSITAVSGRMDLALLGQPCGPARALREPDEERASTGQGALTGRLPSSPPPRWLQAGVTRRSLSSERTSE